MSSNSTIRQLEREISLAQVVEEEEEEGKVIQSTPPVLPLFVSVSDSEQLTTAQSVAGESSTSAALESAQTADQVDYEMISDSKNIKSTVQPSKPPPVIVVEPSSQSEEQQQPLMTERAGYLSPLRLEPVSDAEENMEQSSTPTGGQLESDGSAEPKDSLRRAVSLLTQEHNYSATCEPATRTSLTKKVAGKEESGKTEKQRRASAGDERKSVGAVQFPKQLSLPSSPLATPTDRYFSLLQSSSQKVTGSLRPPSLGLPLQACPSPTGQQDASQVSSSDRVPEILSELIASLNAETMQIGTLSSPSSLASTPSTLTASPTTLDSSSCQDGDKDGGNRVSGIVSDLVMYLTAETMQKASVAASDSETCPAIPQGLDIEVCDSPLSLVSGSERVPYSSDCDASGEDNSDDGVRESEICEYHYIDADSLFVPSSNALFSIGDDVPPLFLLPRLACAGDFPLEVEPRSISSVALEAAQQGVIHAPPNNDLSSDNTTSHSFAGEVSDGSNLGAESYVTATADTEDGYSTLTADESDNMDRLQAPLKQPHPLTTRTQALPIGPLPSTKQIQAPPTKTHPLKLEKPPTKPHLPTRAVQKAKRTKATLPPKVSTTSVKSSAQSKAAPKRSSLKASNDIKSDPMGEKITKGGGVVVGGASSKLSKDVLDRTLSKPSTAAREGGMVKKVVPGSKKKGSVKLQTQLEEHMARLEELKGHLASKATSQPTTSTTSTTQPLNAEPSLTSSSQTTKSKTIRKRKRSTSHGSAKKSAASASSPVSGDLSTCARTSGYAYVRKTVRSKTSKIVGKDNKKSDSAKESSSGSKSKSQLAIQMSDIFDVVLAGTGSRPSSLEDLHTKLNQLWLSNLDSLLETESGPHPLPAVSILGGSCTIPSRGHVMAVPSPTVTEMVGAGVENLIKPKKQLASHSHAADSHPTHRSTSYRPYSSPLLMFQSYRLNPLYRTNEKLPLHSLSHSNRIDPNRIMCRFELGGICNNTSCTGQHFKDIRLNKEELIEDLVSYAPQLAGLSEGEKMAEPEREAETVKGKMASYATQMVSRYSNKVPDEDLFKLTVHDVNKERAKLRSDPKAKPSYISFDDRRWLTRKGDSLNPLSVKHPISLLAVEEAVASQDGEEEKSEKGIEWDTISKELLPLSGHGHEARCVLYVCVCVCVNQDVSEEGEV